jgi:hypothetical protein
MANIWGLAKSRKCHALDFLALLALITLLSGADQALSPGAPDKEALQCSIRRQVQTGLDSLKMGISALAGFCR